MSERIILAGRVAYSDFVIDGIRVNFKFYMEEEQISKITQAERKLQEKYGIRSLRRNFNIKPNEEPNVEEFGSSVLEARVAPYKVLSVRDSEGKEQAWRTDSDWHPDPDKYNSGLWNDSGSDLPYTSWDVYPRFTPGEKVNFILTLSPVGLYKIGEETQARGIKGYIDVIKRLSRFGRPQPVEYDPSEFDFEDENVKPLLSSYKDEIEEIDEVSKKIRLIRKNNPSQSICILYPKNYNIELLSTLMDKTDTRFGEYIPDGNPTADYVYSTFGDVSDFPFVNLFLIGLNDKIISLQSQGTNEGQRSPEDIINSLVTSRSNGKKLLFISSFGAPSPLLATINPDDVVIDDPHNFLKSIYQMKLKEIQTQHTAIRESYEDINANISELEDRLENPEKLEEDSNHGLPEIASSFDNNEELKKRYLDLKTADEKTIQNLKAVSAQEANLALSAGLADEHVKNYYGDAKILVFGDTNIKSKVLNQIFGEYGNKFNVKRKFWDHYPKNELRNFDIQSLRDSRKYSDIFVGAVPHSTKGLEGASSPVTFLNQYHLSGDEGNFTKVQVSRRDDGGGLTRITKGKLNEMIKQSNWFAWHEGI